MSIGEAFGRGAATGLAAALVIPLTCGGVALYDRLSGFEVTVKDYTPGPGWKPVSEALGASMEADDASLDEPTYRDWSICWYTEGDTSYIVCPDGYVWTS